MPVDITSRRTPAPLLGLAIGDALGAPFETMPHGDPRLVLERDLSGALVFSPTPPHAPWPDGHAGLAAGQYTDDTKMAVALTKSLLAAGDRRMHAPINAAHYIGWFLSGDLRGIGGTTRGALEALLLRTKEAIGGDAMVALLERDPHLVHAGTHLRLGQTGNGTAMRAAPIGVRFRNDWAALADACGSDAAITHPFLEAATASTAVALGVALALDGVDPAAMVATILATLAPSEVRSRLVLAAKLAGDIPMPCEDKVPIAQGARLGAGFTAAQAVARAFYALLVGGRVEQGDGRHFAATMEAAILPGGDTDTIGAIAGAIAGTLYGRAALPPTLVATLEDADLLNSLSERLLSSK